MVKYRICENCFEKFEVTVHNKKYCSHRCRCRARDVRTYHKRKDRGDPRFATVAAQRAKNAARWREERFIRGECVRCGKPNPRHPRRRNCEECSSKRWRDDR